MPNEPERLNLSETAADPSLGDLVRQLAQDSATLVRQEMALAKAEMRENARGMTKAIALLAVGGAAMLLALLALTAFLVIVLGDWMGDEYWLGALAVALLYGVIGAILLASGRGKLKQNELRPDQTLQTLREDQRWAKSQAQQFKRDLTTG